MKNKSRDIYGWIIAGVLAVVSLVTGLMSFGHSGSSTPDILPPIIAEEPGEVVEITADEFANLVENQDDFVAIMYMTVCPAEFPLSAVAKEYAHNSGATIYSLTEEEFKQTDLAEIVKYLPSAAVYRDGKLVKYLDAEKDEDMPYYKTAEAFGEWVK